MPKKLLSHLNLNPNSFFLYQNKFSEAKAIFDLVITQGTTASGTPYGLVPYYGDVFRSINDNNEESVFAVQAAAGTGSVFNANPALALNFPFGGRSAPGGCCGFFQPSLDLANSFRTTATGLPLLDQSYNDSINALKTDLGLTSTDDFIPDTGNLDPRIDHCNARSEY